MGALRAVIAIALLVLAMPVSAQVSRWRPIVEEASTRFGVPTDWIERVMAAESAGRTQLGGRPIVSSAGAMGLMQVMPDTYAAMRDRLGLGTDPYQPRDNILAGVLYLRLMYDRFGYPGLFAAYNAGPARYAQFLNKGRPLPAETMAYVSTVSGSPLSSRAPTVPPPAVLQSPIRSSIFFDLRGVEVGERRSP